MEEERWRILIIEWMNHQDQGVIKKGSEKSLIATARGLSETLRMMLPEPQPVILKEKTTA